jgi:16S rRNA (guanine527-N7)-methyltransferase
MIVASLIESEAQAQDWLRQVLGVDDATMARLARLVDLLVEENERQNLIARGTIPMVWQRHIVDSAQLLAVPRETLPEGPWLDLGTGAGFPGLVIARAAARSPGHAGRFASLHRMAGACGAGTWACHVQVFWRAWKICRIKPACFRRALLRRWTSFLRFLRVFPHRKRCGCLPKGRRLRRIGLSAGNLAPPVPRGTIADRSAAGVIAGRLLGGNPPKPARPGGSLQRGSRR